MLAAVAVAAVAVLAVAGYFLYDTQRQQREDLRDRYADRVVVSAALLDSLFGVAFAGQADELAATFGERVDPKAVQARVREGNAQWGMVVDARGRVLAATSDAPRGAAQRRMVTQPFVRRALRPGGYGLGSVDGQTIPTAAGFATPTGARAFVSGAPLATYKAFLEGTLQPLPGVRRARAYVLDGNGRRIGAAAQGIDVPPRTPRLLEALEKGSSGFFEGDTGTRYFAARPIRGSRWRLVVTVPEDVLYSSTSGTGRAVPWVIFALSALALLGIGLLLRRLLRATGALASSNAELGEANAELARSNADLEQFAYVASHDLSEPLRTVAGFSQLIGKRYRGRLDAEADLFIDHMTAGVDRMQQLIDDLLLYSRVGRAPIGRAHVDLDDVLGEVLHAIEPAMRERGAQITSGDLPTVVGEHGQLRQVFQNVLVNALKFTAPDVTPQVHIDAERDGGFWRITVADNGIGVPEGQHDAIFKMFGRLHPGDAYPGTGIGLALVRRVVERHGGEIWVSPRPGGGSVFAFTLPDRARLVEPATPRARVTS